MDDPTTTQEYWEQILAGEGLAPISSWVVPWQNGTIKSEALVDQATENVTYQPFGTPPLDLVERYDRLCQWLPRGDRYVLELTAKGLTQVEIGKLIGRCQVSAGYRQRRARQRLIALAQIEDVLPASPRGLRYQIEKHWVGRHDADWGETPRVGEFFVWMTRYWAAEPAAHELGLSQSTTHFWLATLRKHKIPGWELIDVVRKYRRARVNGR